MRKFITAIGRVRDAVMRHYRFHRMALHIEISLFAPRTEHAKVHIALASRHGRTRCHAFDDDDAGNMRASIVASEIAYVTGLKVIDRRPAATNEARGILFAFAGAEWRPCDQPSAAGM